MATSRVTVDNGQTVLVRTFSVRGSDVQAFAGAFNRECEIFEQISHPALPRLLRHAIDADQLTLVLDHPAGVTLGECVASRLAGPGQGAARLDIPHVLYWARQLAEAVLFLHRQRPFPVIHRNLTPDTVRVVGPQEDIRLLDFGLPSCLYPDRLAKQILPSASEFNEPLLFRSMWGDPRADVYSFGMLLRFLAAAALPEQSVPGWEPLGNAADLKMSLLLDAIADRCCCANVRDRYSGMAGVIDALRNAVSPNPAVTQDQAACVCGQLNRTTARFCRNCGLSLRSPDPEVRPVTADAQFTYEGETELSLLTSYDQKRFSTLPRYRMMETLHEIDADPGFEELLSLSNLPEVAKMQHQKDAVLRALKQMRGRALLADEVGLGKTVEAGIFLKELLLRGLVDKMLIVCPSIVLAAQWQSELYEKFNEIALVFGHDIDTSLAWECSRLITTYDVLRQPFHTEELLRHQYDLVILDEAHFLNDEEHAAILETVKKLQKKYFLMLSATPMHRSLRELYNIVTLLRPGHFEDLASFEREFMDPEDELRAKNLSTLRPLLHQIMVRNRRQDIKDYVFPRRKAVLRQLTLSSDAQRFYDKFREFLKAAVLGVSNTAVLGSVADLAERLCSSPEAFASQVNRLQRNSRVRQVLGDAFLRELNAFAANCPESLAAAKLQATVEILQQHTKTRSRALAFSQFDETARYVFRRLQTTPLKAACFLYDPAESFAARQSAVRKMAETPGGILVCPGEASEGLNLQVANLMVNLDLPWNPMKLEQRIGRIQRIGGKKDVLIVNLVLKGTIEEKIYEICDRRIEMFEAIVGHVEEILGNLEEDIEVLIRDFYLDRQVVTDDGEQLTAEENLDRAIDDAESRFSKPGEERLSQIYGAAQFDPATAEEEEV